MRVVVVREAREVDPEQLAFEMGLKPALRLALPEPLATRRERELSGAGFAVARAAGVFGREQLLYVAHDRQTATALRDAEAPIRPGSPPSAPSFSVTHAHHLLGTLLGYPQCCIHAFVGRVERDVTRAPDGRLAHEDFVAALDILSRTVRADALLNCFPLDRGQPLVSFYPCRFDCAAGLGYGRALLDAVRARAPEGARLLAARLAAPVAISRDGARVRPEDAAPGAPVLRFA